MIVLYETDIHPLALVKGDSIKFTLTAKNKILPKFLNGQKIFEHTHFCNHNQTINHTKILYYKHFQGMKHVFVWAVGEKDE